MQPRFVYVTCKNKEEALLIGQVVVKERLAACANVIGGMAAVYWWKGELVTEQEAVLIFKTQENRMDALIEKVKSEHSYSVPCVVALPILEGNPDYLSWIIKESEN
ncbi:MAG TPA: divalent-cation tolerance protein CutA [Bacteroidetes bacterium]|nr:divalent-cation tolerance protein CutA [Bacteroidota bacterium]